MKPGTLSAFESGKPSALMTSASFFRLSGQSICSIESLKESIRASTEASHLNFPTELLRRNGAVDHKLINDGGRVKPRPPPGNSEPKVVPSIGLFNVIFPTEGKV